MPTVLGMIFDQRGYPPNEELVGNLIVMGAAVATIGWGVLLGRFGRWSLVGASVLFGAVLMTVLGEISLRLVPRGDPSGPVVGLLFNLVVLGLLLGLGGLIGTWMRRLRHKAV